MALVHLSFMFFTKAHIYVSPCPPFRCPISVWHQLMTTAWYLPQMNQVLATFRNLRAINMSRMFSIRQVPSMNSIATKLSQRQFIFLFVCLFVLYFQTADSYGNEVTLLAGPCLLNICQFRWVHFTFLYTFVSELFSSIWHTIE